MKNRVTLIALVGALIVYFCTSFFGLQTIFGEDQSVEEAKSNVTVNANGYDLEGNESLITDFFTVLYESQKNLESGDLASFFNDEKEAALAQTYIDDLIYKRNSQKISQILGYDITLNVEDVKKENSTIYIDLAEDQDLEFSTGTAESPGILSTVAVKDGKLSSYYREEDLYLALSEVGDVPAYSEKFRAQVEKTTEELERARQNQDSPEDSSGYDRSAAVNYAKEHVFNKNSDYFDYDEFGGNCSNFVSQCLVAGGIPQDPGEWYPGSSSWILVDGFYNYAAKNQSGGLRADVNANFFEGEPGDILQVGNLGEFRHSVIITDVVRDEDGKTVDYLVASNSLDRNNYPVSNYGYSDVRLIKILGGNR